MQRSIVFSQEHEIFRESVRKFFDAEVNPHYEEWEKAGIVPREIWKRFGDMGFLLPWAEESMEDPGPIFSFPSSSSRSWRGSAPAGYSSPFTTTSWPPISSASARPNRRPDGSRGAPGDTILAIAMTEPEAGSDLASMKTTATRDGDALGAQRGPKTFISNGILADLVIVAAKTGDDSAPQKG